jgi:diguanylate cyclase (GGDEF)-like protein
MTASKLRVAIVVLLVGSALGTAVFGASQLVVRSMLNADAVSTAEALADRLAGDDDVPADRISAVQRYVYFDADAVVLDSSGFGEGAALRATLNAAEMEAARRRAAEVAAIVLEPPLLPTLLGLAEPAIGRVAVPVVSAGSPTRTLYAEIDQRSAAQALAWAFGLIGMITLGLAVLATLLVLGLTRSRATSSDRQPRDMRVLSHDPLTGLPTREAFKVVLADALNWARNADQQVGLLIVEINEFGKVNEVWGHAAGDAILKTTAERLRGFVDTPAALGRISGTTFALIMERDANSHSLRQLSENIREALANPYAVQNSSVALEASFGAALFPVNADDPDVLFRAADTALRQSKADGRGALVFFDTEMENRIQRRIVLEQDLKRALGRNEFVVFYQPQLELASGRVRGYEALVRWERPGEGIVTPRDFLAVAEETGLIRQLGEWVLGTACRDAATWLNSGTVAVNFSAAQFHRQNLHATISKALSESGLPPERLEIEVPESLFLDHAPEVMDQLARIKALGVRVAMDNFGAGYSGLASLAHFPFNKIKIDRSFVSQLTEEEEVAAIVASVVGLGRSLSLDITAEGVETEEQVTLLRAAGCSIVQGFLFGAPSRDAALAATPEARAAEADEAGSAAAAATSS